MTILTHDTTEPVISVPKAIPTTRLCATPTEAALLGEHDGVDGGCVEHEMVIVVVVVVTMTEGKGDMVAGTSVGDGIDVSD